MLGTLRHGEPRGSWHCYLGHWGGCAMGHPGHHIWRSPQEQDEEEDGVKRRGFGVREVLKAVGAWLGELGGHPWVALVRQG